MDQVGTTYSNTYSLKVPVEKTVATPEGYGFNKVSDETRPDTVTVKINQPETFQSDNVQLSKNPASEKQQEFKTYNTNGRIEDETRKKDTSTKLNQDQTAPSDQEKKEDPQIQQVISQLKAIEIKVKAHEAAHKSAGGAATGPVSYSYTRGPDGRNYITGGEVPISISSGSTPQETINRMQQVIQAALAPADPSPQDRAVAAQAANIKQQAQQEKSQQNTPQIGKETTNEPQTDTARETTPAASDDPAIGSGQKDAFAQISRNAYTDPAVGRQSDYAKKSADKTDTQYVINTTINIIPPADSRQPSSGINTAMISGHASSKPISFYA